MSYRVGWSKTFVTDEFRVHSCSIHGCPEVCTAHTPFCFKCVGAFASRRSGHWSLLDPLSIADIMPGTKQKLLEMSIKALLDDGVQWGYIIENSIRLLADGAEIFKRDVYHDVVNVWKANKWALNADISTVNRLDIDLDMDVDGTVGWATLHNAQIILSGEYYTVVPPATATVRVTVRSRETDVLIAKAYVALMSGATVIADGYTDGGEISFANINEGSYTVKVRAGGYYDFEQSIDVVAPSVWYDVKIVPIPVVPLPDWVKYAALGIGALGVITVVPAVIRRKPEEKVFVLK